MSPLPTIAAGSAMQGSMAPPIAAPPAIAPDLLRAWGDLAQGNWPVEAGTAWLEAEWARITPRSRLHVRPGSAAVSWLLVDGGEERAGFGAYELLLDAAAEDALQDAGSSDAADWDRLAQERARGAGLRQIRTATITTTAAYFPGVIWDRSLPPSEQRQAIRGAIEHVLADARASGASVLAVANVPEGPPFDLLRDELARLGLAQVACAPDSALPIPSGGLDEYLALLPPRYRQVVRREMRVFAGFIDRVAVYDAARLRARDLLELLRLRYGKYGHATHTASLMDRLVRVSAIDGVCVVVVERAGKAIGFAALVLDAQGRRLIPRLSACIDNDAFVYFNMIFYELIRLGSEWRFKELALGTTAYRAKLLRGARLRPLSNFSSALDGCMAAPLRAAMVYRNELERARITGLMPLMHTLDGGSARTTT